MTEIEKYDNGEGEDFKKSLEPPKGGKGRIFGIIAIIVIVLAVISISVFLIYHYQSGRKEALLMLSSGEITSLKEASETEYAVRDRVYFLVGRKSLPLNADVIIIEIEKKQNGEYQRYKQISFEIEKDFQKLHAYIPGVYFREGGAYRIKAYLDNRVISNREILVGN